MDEQILFELAKHFIIAGTLNALQFTWAEFLLKEIL
jgi:hypothetical protein